jgi:sporulation protein YabP
MEQNLTLNNRKQLDLTGIKKVKSTEPNAIIALLETGGIQILGQNLSVQSLDLNSGNMSIHGNINSVRYTDKVSKSFSFRNIFK